MLTDKDYDIIRDVRIANRKLTHLISDAQKVKAELLSIQNKCPHSSVSSTRVIVLEDQHERYVTDFVCNVCGKQWREY